MSEFYASAPIALRDDLAEAHARAWGRIGCPGTWWDGVQRVAIAAETRHALACALCHQRKEALSPAAIGGRHDSLGALPDAVVEVVHRVRTDPSRLSISWFRGVIAGDFSEEQYVETVSIVAHVVAIDTMAGGLGFDLLAVPRPEPGAPSPRARRGEELFRPCVAPIPGAAPNARLLARIPGDHSRADRAVGGAGVSLEPMSLLNDQSHFAAPCERRDPQ